MSLPLSDIVQVNIAVAPTLAPLAGFGELLFLTSDQSDLNVISTGERIRKFGSLKEVQDAMPQGSECIRGATAFYSQTPQPKHFTVGVMSTVDTAAQIVGGSHSDIDTLKTISNQKMKFLVDNTGFTATVTFTGKNSLDEIATTLQTALRGATKDSGEVNGGTTSNMTATYSGGRFVVSSGTKGNDSHITYMTDVNENSKSLPQPKFDLPLEQDISVRTPADAAAMLGLTQATAMRIVDGSGSETVSSALSLCADVSNSFIGVTLSKTMRDSSTYVSGADGAAMWCQASKKIFLNTTNDYRILNLNTQAGTIAKELKDKSLGYTITTFSNNEDEYPSCSLFGRISTVNYEGTATTITLKFKKLPTVTVLKLTTPQKVAMDSLYVGGFMSFGGNYMYAESRMANGGWLDSVHGLLWLENRIQVDVFNVIYGTTTKIPYNDTGINMVVQKVTAALEQARTNGLISAGKTPEGVFLPDGYAIQALGSTEVSASDKSNRLYRGITFQCIGAGALHNVIISGSFSE